ncbi:lytic transglycosylase domain-containing protein [Psychrobacillus sp. OK032]|uniref:lytic transglycosylase domain-containing protein n=1 Tax=Psychrobacillus sp. OK032 TaxID=1884358 RepID=UPI0008BA6670|nr:lytic transglycosylase domain-containing protein [Psychrobacillus sp. OK032]SER62856.1 Transglycosylase SLT domain-containing protein [Psychrobacillus sp. OK032]
MDIQSLKTLMEINAMQTLGSVQSSLNNSPTSLFSEMLGQVLQSGENNAASDNGNSLYYNGNSPVFMPSNLVDQNEDLLNAIAHYTPLDKLNTSDFNDIIKRAAETHNVPEKLISSVIKQESNFNPSARSSAGASGLMQLMPGTAKYLGVVNIFDPEQNVMGGAKYLRQMLDQFNDDTEIALAAYNAGPGAVKKHGGIPPYKETQNYVQKVLNYYQA